MTYCCQINVATFLKKKKKKLIYLNLYSVFKNSVRQKNCNNIFFSYIFFLIISFFIICFTISYKYRSLWIINTYYQMYIIIQNYKKIFFFYIQRCLYNFVLECRTYCWAIASMGDFRSLLSKISLENSNPRWLFPTVQKWWTKNQPTLTQTFLRHLGLLNKY